MKTELFIKCAIILYYFIMLTVYRNRKDIYGLLYWGISFIAIIMLMSRI